MRYIRQSVSETWRSAIRLCFGLLLACCWLPQVGAATTEEPSGGGQVVAADGAQDSFSFVVWGHWRGPGDGDPPLHFEAVLAKLRELNPDLVLILGDSVSGGASRSKPLNPDLIRSDWQRIDDALGELDIPVYMVPGNHDINNLTTRDIFLDRYPKPPYAFTFKDSRFVVLDTIGIDQRINDEGRYWELMGLPFDDAQIAFIRREIQEQDKYEHVFFFMHHTHSWAEPDGDWWTRVQPMLKGGRTRAVFAGDPYGAGKFGYLKRDGVTFIKTAMFETPGFGWFKQFTYDRLGWALVREPDMLQQVRVLANEVDIRSVVIDPLNTETLSLDFWRDVHASFNWRQNFMTWFHWHVYRFRHLLMLFAAWGFAAFLLGIVATVLWRRWRSQP